MTNNTATSTATLIAPLTAAPSCALEMVWIGFTDGTSLSVWVRPDSLAATLKAKRVLAPGKVIDETLTEADMGSIGAKWLSVDGPVFEF